MCEVLGGAFQMTSCELWCDCFIRKVPIILGRHRWYQSSGFVNTRESCRITLPMDIVESSVKMILLKTSWIDMSSSTFYSLPSCFYPLTIASFESSLLPASLRFRFCVGGWYFAFILAGPFFGSSSSSMWARIHCWRCREGTSCWWCRQVQHDERISDSLINSFFLHEHGSQGEIPCWWCRL
jgi:hypothetical protein